VVKLGKVFQKCLHKVDLAYSVEKAYPELNFYEVNMKVKLIVDDNSMDTLKRLREIREYHARHPEIPYSDVFKRIMTRKPLKLVKDAR
jgi:hypothetical protein